MLLACCVYSFVVVAFVVSRMMLLFVTGIVECRELSSPSKTSNPRHDEDRSLGGTDGESQEFYRVVWRLSIAFVLSS